MKHLTIFLLLMFITAGISRADIPQQAPQPQKPLDIRAQLRKDAQSDDPKVRHKALYQMMNYKMSRDVARMLEHENRTTRLIALSQLAFWKQYHYLKKYLDSKDRDMAAIAARGLLKEYPDLALPLFIKGMTAKDRSTAYYCGLDVYKNANKTCKRHVPALIKLLEYEFPKTRAYAAAALGNIGDIAALEPVMRLLEKELIRIPKNSIYDSSDMHFYGICYTIGAIGKLGDSRVIPALNKALDYKPSKHLKDYFFKTIKHWPRDTVLWTAGAVLWAIQNIGGREIIPIIKRILKEEKNAKIRYAAVSALSKAKSKEAMTLLCRLLGNDPDKQIRLTVAFILRGYNDRAAISALITVLEQDPDADVRQESAVTLELMTRAHLGVDAAKWREWWLNSQK